MAAEEILVTWMDYDADDLDCGARLLSAGYQLKLAPKKGTRDAHEVATLAANSVGAIVSTDPFDSAVFAAAPRLRVIARVGVGTDSIDLQAATKAGCVVTVTRGVNSETTADHTLALMLAALRRVIEHDAGVRNGRWDRSQDHWPWDLYGATVGLIGFGEIGQAVARRLAGFGVELLVCEPALSKSSVGYELVGLPDLLRRSTVVSVHVPLTSGTKNLIGREELALMRPEAVLVNTARGGIVDEGALALALRHRSLRGAALDVFDGEPAVAEFLLGLPNIVLSPHLGGISVESVKAMTAQATRSVINVLGGEPDPTIVANPDVLNRFATVA